MTSLVRRAPLVLALALVTLLATGSPAEGHALLLRSEPAQDARLFESPDSIAGWFSEPLEAGVSSLKVIDATGRRVDSGTTEVDAADPTKMLVSFRENLRPGFYLVTWETLSRIDGHFRFGSFQFAVLNPDGSLPPGAPFSEVGGPGEGGGLDLDRSLVKAMSLVGQAGLVGALAFYLLVARPAAARQPASGSASLTNSPMRHLWSAAFAFTALLAIAGIAELVVQLGEAPATSGLDEVLATAWGGRWLQRQVVLVGIVMFFVLAYRNWGRGFLWLALAGGFVYLALTASTSHGAAIERGSFWATVLDFIHLLAAAVWIGGLAQLARLLVLSRSELEERARLPFVAEALRRFSLLAVTAVVPLLATGVLNAFVQVPRFSSLVDTDYGIALTAKLIVVVLLLAVAGANAFVLRPGMIRATSADESGDRIRRLLSHLVSVEATLGLAVLLLTGFLTQLTTARALAQIGGDTAFTVGSDLANPLIATGWTLLIAGVFLAFGILGVLWTRGTSGCLGWTVRSLSHVSVGIPLIILAVLAVDAANPERRDPDTTGTVRDNVNQPRDFQPELSLLLQLGENRLVSLQVEPFEVGDNTFRATVLDHDSEPVRVDSLLLHFSRLEQRDVASEVATLRADASGSYFGTFSMQETGWWAIEAVVDGEQPVPFYVRLDEPSRAPESFAPPQYASDPKAEELFARAMNKYQDLSSVAWYEQLTSGLEKPRGLGVWFATVGEAVAPDLLHFQVLSQDGPQSDRYYVGPVACNQIEGQPFECSEGDFRPDVFDLDYMRPSAFKLGRQEVLDGEMSQVVLFYNPNQRAWYAWWVGVDSGLLRRQAMVATGHFMLSQFAEHNAPLAIELPEQARP